MRKFKLEAFEKEFPFLRELLEEKSPQEINSIKIKRADENLLARIPQEYYWDGSCGVTSQWDCVSFVLEDGKILRNAVLCEGEKGSNYAHSQTSSWEGETVLEALSRLNDPNDVKYIIWEDRDLHNWQGSEVVDYYEIIICKPPKGVKYSDLIARAREKALAEVRAETNF